MPGLPNPWVLLGAFVSVVVLCVVCFFYGQHVAGLSYQAAIDKQMADKGNELDALQKVSDAKSATLSDLKTTLENTNGAHAAALQAAKDANDKLNSDLNALRNAPPRVVFVPGRGSDSKSAVSGSAPAPAVAPESPAAAGLSSEVTSALIDLAHDADTDADALYNVCVPWAKGVNAVTQPDPKRAQQ